MVCSFISLVAVNSVTLFCSSSLSLRRLKMNNHIKKINMAIKINNPIIIPTINPILFFCGVDPVPDSLLSSEILLETISGNCDWVCCEVSGVFDEEITEGE